MEAAPTKSCRVYGSEVLAWSIPLFDRVIASSFIESHGSSADFLRKSENCSLFTIRKGCLELADFLHEKVTAVSNMIVTIINLCFILSEFSGNDPKINN